jgi:sugar phosphate permease
MYSTAGMMLRSRWLVMGCVADPCLLCVHCLQSMLGQVDLAFLAAYAAGMFFAGHMGDRTDLRVFLSVGMLGSGIFCTLFGMVSSSSRPAMPGACLQQAQAMRLQPFNVLCTRWWELSASS